MSKLPVAHDEELPADVLVGEDVDPDVDLNLYEFDEYQEQDDE